MYKKGINLQKCTNPFVISECDQNQAITLKILNKNEYTVHLPSTNELINSQINHKLSPAVSIGFSWSSW